MGKGNGVCLSRLASPLTPLSRRGAVETNLETNQRSTRSRQHRERHEPLHTAAGGGAARRRRRRRRLSNQSCSFRSHVSGAAGARHGRRGRGALRGHRTVVGRVPPGAPWGRGALRLYNIVLPRPFGRGRVCPVPWVGAAWAVASHRVAPYGTVLCTHTAQRRHSARLKQAPVKLYGN
jgi:hypothetical protein